MADNTLQGQPILGDATNTGTTTPVPLTLSASGLIGALATGTNELSPITLNGVHYADAEAMGAVNLGDPGNFGSGLSEFASLPATALLSAVYSANLALPELGLDGSLEGPLLLPSLSLSAQGQAGASATGALEWPLLSIPSSAVAGAIGTGDGQLDALNVQALTGWHGNAVLDLPSVAGSLLAGRLLNAALTLERLSLQASSLSFTNTQATGQATVRLSAEGAALSGQAGPGQALLLPLGVQGAALTDGRFSGQALLSSLTLNAASVAGTAAQATLLLPAPALTAVLTTPLSVNTGQALLTWPLLTSVASGHGGTRSTGDAQTAPFSAAGVSRAGTVATGAVQAPALGVQGALVGPVLPAAGSTAVGLLTLAPASLLATGHGASRSSAALNLAALTLNGQGLSGQVATAVVQASALTLQASATAPLPVNPAAGAALLAVLAVSAQALQHNTAAGVLGWRAPSLAAQGLTGQAAAGQLVLSLPALAGTLAAPPAGTVATGALTLAALTASGLLASGPLITGDARLSLDVLARGAAGQVAQLSPSGPTLALSASAQSAMLANTGAGNAALAPLALSAPLFMGPLLNSAIAWPRLGLQAAASTGTVSAGLLTLSVPAVAAVLSAPLPDNAMQGNARLALPALSAGTLTSSALLDAVLSWPAYGVQASAVAGGVGQAQLVLPALGLAAQLSAPAPDSLLQGGAAFTSLALNAVALAGSLGRASLMLGAPSLDAQASANTLAQGQAALLHFTLLASAQGAPVQVADVQLTVPALVLQGTALAGNVAHADLTLTLVRLNADGAAQALGTAQVRLPLLHMDAGALVQTLAAPRFTGVVLNPRSQAVSRYEGVQANSLCLFGGLTLAATESGIVALTGDTDLGKPIAAQVAGGASDLGLKTAKTVLAAYVGYHASGALELTLITDTHHEYVYRLEPRQIGQQHTSRVKFGRGVQGSYWQWRLANRDGADFALDSLALEVLALQRRVAG